MTRPLPRPVRVYRVGGSVRDELLQRPPGDRDYVVVGATPEIMLASGYRPVGRDFPVFLHPDTQEEYALARTERKHGRGYRGFEFFATPDVTLEEDLRRRDLTINAMARTPDGTLIDPYGGQSDLARHRCIGRTCDARARARMAGGRARTRRSASVTAAAGAAGMRSARRAVARDRRALRGAYG